MGPKRDWSDARAKIDAEGGLCRVCAAFSAEAAHIIGRSHDEPKTPGSKTLYVKPERIVPLCCVPDRRCHERYDAHALDLLSYLTLDEQVQAVRDAGGIESARRRLCPSEFVQAGEMAA